MGRIKSSRKTRKISYKDWLNPTLEKNWGRIEEELKSSRVRKEVFFQSTSDSYAPHMDPKVTRRILG
jgi:hypothetical protein